MIINAKTGAVPAACQRGANSVASDPQAAGVAELADALDSKSSTRKGVWVRSPPPAPPGHFLFVIVLGLTFVIDSR